ncbi:MAG TPA: demethoxyubiquinone hydroxylase family protein [Thermodesulfobacteriota bacterium]|nr:demethoxyubiquinone hydroxylase family protein [Deltaproteobacteria bacterium]HNR13983.1 demethoxyubiquinone hydroxylase family protein [Thermodesulfobacteriota bacterium]HNU70889.1 demethoxyubiquinone hydroxylase family protein [Thermodesulfobacteriota bacterium]HOC38143.1 demethoxyubiquinone hydroxylase family protein [Thermodesulfobacteriota bacterium]HQO78439.1 demethoxyubiquinone hydroxylase family protein [Thermodesulfobacteriota bacterium]
MPDFANPFSGNVPDRKMTREELIRAIRLDIAAELEAVNLYMAQADVTEDPLARKVLIDVADEEREHIGEFLHLVQLLTGNENELLEHGKQEVVEMAEELQVEATGGEAVIEETPVETSSSGLTVGNLKS